MIDNSKEAVNGAVAVKALNTVKVYCATHLCPITLECSYVRRGLKPGDLLGFDTDEDD